MANKALHGEPTDPLINFSEVADFPEREELFPNLVEELTRQIRDNEGNLLGELRVYCNETGEEALMILYVPDTMPDVNPDYVKLLGDSMTNLAIETKSRIPQLTSRRGRLHLLEFILPKKIEVSLLKNFRDLLSLQFQHINGITTTTFNSNVQFTGSFSALNKISKVVKVGFFRGIKNGQEGFMKKRNVDRSDFIVEGEEMIHEEA